MGPQKTLLLLILIRVATGAPVEGEAPPQNTPSPSPSDLETFRNLSPWPQQQQQQHQQQQQQHQHHHNHHTPPPPSTISSRDLMRLNEVVLPDTFTIHKPCLEAIVIELCLGVFNNPKPTELEARRANNNFTCMGQGCKLQQLALYCNKTPDSLNQDPIQSQPMTTNASHSHSPQQPQQGTLQSPHRRGSASYTGFGEEFPMVSQPQEENGVLTPQRNDLPYVNRIDDYINESRIQEVGRSCGHKYSCLRGDCCSVFHKARGCHHHHHTNQGVLSSPPTLTTTTTTTSPPLPLPLPLPRDLNSDRVAAFRLLLSDFLSHTNWPTRGRGRRQRRKRRLYNFRTQGILRRPRPINHSLEYSGPPHLFHPQP
ncbi:hypothetical protein Pmani_024967 [Petrolisthes manimaculis]|uniref:Uncharacterized protein n=1 Tax=Petrolisthes manimaculis TaxID=1843537 RepID=A0AAE1U1M7_9EUCA|nr:hypothetical protein Pmani_024967 [Petrolisthes manimaculis]